MPKRLGRSVGGQGCVLWSLVYVLEGEAGDEEFGNHGVQVEVHGEGHFGGGEGC